MVQMLDGVIIDGKFRLIEAVGKGGMSVVYRGQQLSLNNREVAVKVMSFDPVENPEHAARFTREAAIVATLEHPYILPIFEYGSDDERRLLYLVTPLMQNGSLKRRILEKGSLSLAETLDVLEKIGSAIHYAHERGVIHRDINPRNMLLSNFGDPILSDFGLARVDGGLQVSQIGYMAGTKAYMSPEQWVGEELDRRCDIYSLGISLYEMLSGEQPFTGETARELAIQHLQEPPPSLLGKAPHLHPAIEAVIFRAVAKLPDQRFDTVRDLVAAFRVATREASAPTARVNPAPRRLQQPAPMEKRTALLAEEGITHIPQPDLTLQLETIALTFAVAREQFDSGQALNIITGLLTPDFPNLAIEGVAIQPGSTVLSLTMLSEACARLFALVRQQPDLFRPFRLTSVRFRNEVWKRPGLSGARSWLLRSAALIVLVLAGALGITLAQRGSAPTSIPITTPGPLAAAPSLEVSATPVPTLPTDALPPTSPGALVVIPSNTAPPPPPTATMPPPTATDTLTALPPTATLTATLTSTATLIPSATVTPSPTMTPSATLTPTPTMTGTLTATPVPEIFPAVFRTLNTLPGAQTILHSALGSVPRPTSLFETFPTRVLIFGPTSPATLTPSASPTRRPTATSTLSASGGSGGGTRPTRIPTFGPSPTLAPTVPPPPTIAPTEPPPPTVPPPPTIAPTEPPPPTDPPPPPTDPPPPPTPLPTGPAGSVCGNGICEPGENKNKCPADCPT